MLHRAKLICSTLEGLKNETNFIRKYLWNNNFPDNFLDFRISKFFHNLDNQKEQISSAQKQRITMVCQFYGEKSKELNCKLRSVFSRYYPQFDLRLVFTNNFRIKSYFPSSPRGPIGMTSGVIYDYTCQNCRKKYIGKSIRHLSTRIHEHMGTSPRTGARLQVPPHSEIRNHIQVQECAIRAENFKILERSSYDRNLLIMESILIKSIRPELNSQDGTFLHVF